MGKDILKSDEAQSVIKDTINSAAKAAKSAITENNKEKAKQEIKDSLKRSKNKTQSAVKRIAKEKLEQVLTGNGKKRRKCRKPRRNNSTRTLLD